MVVLLRPSNEVLPRARVRGAQDYRERLSILSLPCVSFFSPRTITFFEPNQLAFL